MKFWRWLFRWLDRYLCECGLPRASCEAERAAREAGRVMYAPRD